MKSRVARSLCPALVIQLGLVLASASVVADEPVAKCKVHVIHALHDDAKAPPDTRLDKLRPYLSTAFASYKHFQLLELKELELKPNSTGKLALPNGKTASLTYVEHLMHNGKHRVRMRLEIEASDAQSKLLNTTFTLDEGGVVLNAGQRHGAGMLVLGVSCETH